MKIDNEIQFLLVPFSVDRMVIELKCLLLT